MSGHHTRPLQPGWAPNVVLDAITRQGKVAIDDFRGHKPVLVGLFRGLHCPFCRRQITAMAQLDSALRDKGIESLTVVNTPIDRARLYLRYHPLPNLLAASDPERVSHRAFGLPNLEFTDAESEWPHKIGMDAVMKMRVDMPGELPEPMDPLTATDFLARFALRRRSDEYPMDCRHRDLCPRRKTRSRKACGFRACRALARARCGYGSWVKRSSNLIL